MSPDSASPAWLGRAGLVAGLVLFAVMLALPEPSGLGPAGWRTAAVGAAMAV